MEADALDDLRRSPGKLSGKRFVPPAKKYPEESHSGLIVFK
jgi:hypothetical protein